MHVKQSRPRWNSLVVAILFPCLVVADDLDSSRFVFAGMHRSDNGMHIMIGHSLLHSFDIGNARHDVGSTLGLVTMIMH
jgi:hypothetical protein